MDNLRLYLLGIGILILLAIYFHGRKKQEDKSRDVFADHEEQQDVLLGQKALLAEEAEPLREQELIPEIDDRVEPDVTEFDDPTEENRALAEPVELNDRIEPILDGGDAEAQVQEMMSEMPEEESLPLVIDKEDVSIHGDEAVPLSVENDDPVVEEITQPTVEEPLTPEEKANKLSSEIVVMYLVAPDTAPFQGPQVLRQFHVNQLRFGDMNIYHRQEGIGESAKLLFSVASMLNPGTLIPTEMNGKDYRGLTLFMRSENVDDPRAVYNQMLHAAQSMAAALGGELRNNKMLPLAEEEIVAQRECLTTLS